VAEPQRSILEMWCIYDHPADYPNHYVLRRWLVGGGKLVPDEKCQLARTIGEARKLVPTGLYCLGRLPGDDRCIAETWV